MIYKIRYSVGGAHVHCRLYVARQPNTTWAKCGEFTVGEAGFEDLQIIMPGIYSWERDPE